MIPFPLCLLLVNARSVAAKRFNPFHKSGSSLLQDNNNQHHCEQGLIVSLSESNVDQRTEEIDAIGCEQLDLNVVVVFCFVSVVLLVVEEDDTPFHD